MSEIIKKIELKKIHPSKLNPRLEINVGRLNELAASILEVGLLEPIIVRPVNDSTRLLSVRDDIGLRSKLDLKRCLSS